MRVAAAAKDDFVLWRAFLPKVRTTGSKTDAHGAKFENISDALAAFCPKKRFPEMKKGVKDPYPIVGKYTTSRKILTFSASNDDATHHF